MTVRRGAESESDRKREKIAGYTRETKNVSLANNQK